MLGQKEKSNTIKSKLYNIKLEQINQEIQAKEGRLKRYRDSQTIQTKQDIPKQRKKILQIHCGEKTCLNC